MFSYVILYYIMFYYMTVYVFKKKKHVYAYNVTVNMYAMIASVCTGGRANTTLISQLRFGSCNGPVPLYLPSAAGRHSRFAVPLSLKF